MKKEMNYDYKVTKHGKYHDESRDYLVKCPECMYNFNYKGWIIEKIKGGNIISCDHCGCEFAIIFRKISIERVDDGN